MAGDAFIVRTGEAGVDARSANALSCGEECDVESVRVVLTASVDVVLPEFDVSESAVDMNDCNLSSSLLLFRTGT